MATTVKLTDSIIEDAKRYGAVDSRSVPKQIEYWAKIGRIAEENPDLSYNFIRKILLAKAEVDNGEVSDYEFG